MISWLFIIQDHLLGLVVRAPGFKASSCRFIVVSPGRLGDSRAPQLIRERHIGPHLHLMVIIVLLARFLENHENVMSFPIIRDGILHLIVVLGTTITVVSVSNESRFVLRTWQK